MMNPSYEIICDIKQKLKIESDYKLAKTMGWSRSRISHYRSGRAQLDMEGCVLAAEILGMNPIILYGNIVENSNQSIAIKTAWKKAVSMTFAISLMISSTPLFSLYIKELPQNVDFSNSVTVYYVKCFMER